MRSVSPFVDDFGELLRLHRLFVAVAVSNPGVMRVRSASDLGERKKTGLLFALSRPPRNLSFARVKTLRGEGVQFMAIADSSPTEYGDSYKGAGGLTKRGELLIEWMSECGITLDLSHASHATAREAIKHIWKRELTMRPIATHAGCHAVYGHPRNYPDDILRKIVELGGYVGIHAVSFWLSEKQDALLDRFAEHVEHAIAVCGGASVGIGSHCIHQDMSMEVAKENFFRMVELLKLDGTLGEHFPDRPTELITEGSRAFRIFDRTLEKRDIPKRVLGLNFRNFMENTFTIA